MVSFFVFSYLRRCLYAGNPQNDQPRRLWTDPVHAAAVCRFRRRTAGAKVSGLADGLRQRRTADTFTATREKRLFQWYLQYCRSRCGRFVSQLVLSPGYSAQNAAEKNTTASAEAVPPSDLHFHGRTADLLPVREQSGAAAPVVRIYSHGTIRCCIVSEHYPFHVPVHRCFCACGRRDHLPRAGHAAVPEVRKRVRHCDFCGTVRRDACQPVSDALRLSHRIGIGIYRRRVLPEVVDPAAFMQQSGVR